MFISCHNLISRDIYYIRQVYKLICNTKHQVMRVQIELSENNNLNKDNKTEQSK